MICVLAAKRTKKDKTPKSENALRKMIQVQEQLELTLSAEISRLSSLVARQQEILRSWKPIVNDYVFKQGSTHRVGNGSQLMDCLDDLEDLEADICSGVERRVHDAYGKTCGHDDVDTCTWRFSKKNDKAQDRLAQPDCWMHLSSPCTPARPSAPSETLQESNKLRCSQKWPSHVDIDINTASPPAVDGLNGKTNRNTHFSAEKMQSNLAQSDSYSSFESVSELPYASKTYGSSDFVRTPFREILSLFHDPIYDSSFDSDPTERSSSKARFQSPESDACDEIQAELMKEVHRILNHSPRFNNYSPH